MRRFFVLQEGEMRIMNSGGSARAKAGTSGLRRWGGNPAPEVSGAATAFVAGFTGLLILIAIAALAPVETVTDGLGGAGASDWIATEVAEGPVGIVAAAVSLLQYDWLLRSFGIALCVAVAGSLLTASTRDWQKLVEHERGGRVVLGALLPELGHVTRSVRDGVQV